MLDTHMNHSCWVTPYWANFHGLSWRRVQCTLIPVSSCSLDMSGHVSIVFRGHSCCFMGFFCPTFSGEFSSFSWQEVHSGSTGEIPVTAAKRANTGLLFIYCVTLKCPRCFGDFTPAGFCLKGEWDSLFYTRPFLKHNNCAGFKSYFQVGHIS